MASSKTAVIRLIFQQLYTSQTGLTRSVITLDDLQTAIAQVNSQNPDQRQASGANPANFWKDFTRRRQSANAWWPEEIFAAGFTGRQLTGGRRSFEFVPLAQGQTEPFPESVAGPTPQTPEYTITSAVLPLASRRLGRSDEPWLCQLVVRLRIIETHLAVFSPLKDLIRQVDHLQNSVKLRRSEIDAIFLAVIEVDNVLRELIVTSEVKTFGQDITMDQLLRQPNAMMSSRGVTQDGVVPMSVRAVGPSRIHVVEFEEVSRAEAETIEQLQVVSDAIYILQPPVPGIGSPTGT